MNAFRTLWVSSAEETWLGTDLLSLYEVEFPLVWCDVCCLFWVFAALTFFLFLFWPKLRFYAAPLSTFSFSLKGFEMCPYESYALCWNICSKQHTGSSSSSLSSSSSSSEKLFWSKYTSTFISVNLPAHLSFFQIFTRLDIKNSLCLLCRELIMDVPSLQPTCSEIVEAESSEKRQRRRAT